MTVICQDVSREDTHLTASAKFQLSLKKSEKFIPPEVEEEVNEEGKEKE